MFATIVQKWNAFQAARACYKSNCKYNKANHAYVAAVNEYRNLHNRRCGFWRNLNANGK